MTTPEPLPRLTWSSLITPWVVGLVGAFLVAMGVLHDSARLVRRAADVARRVDAARALTVADSAALAAFAADAPVAWVSTAGDRATVARQAGLVQIEARLANGDVHRFVAPELSGAPPAAFARACSFTVAGDGLSGLPLAPAQMPRLEVRLLERAARADAANFARRDLGVALLQWQAGTDADDFVCRDALQPRELEALGELLVVPGHLWIESGNRALELFLSHDLVVVVMGNLYLARSVRVRGPGRLVFVTTQAPGGCAFVDADGNGRWSAGEALLGAATFGGPIEGSGNVYCGGRGSEAPIDFPGGLMVGGQLHLLTDTVVAGPVVLGHGLTALRPQARLQPLGEWAFHPERERVPGFVTTGAPRPGRLRACEPGPDAPANMGKQPLYLPGPPR